MYLLIEKKIKDGNYYVRYQGSEEMCKKVMENAKTRSIDSHIIEI